MKTLIFIVLCLVWFEIIARLFLWCWPLCIVVSILSFIIFNFLRLWWSETGGLDEWLGGDNDNEENKSRKDAK